MKNTVLIILFLAGIHQMFSQELDLPEYEWKNRVVLIITNGNSSLRKQQLYELHSSLREFEERKLAFFEIQPQRYRRISLKLKTENQDNWIYSEQPYEKYKSKKSKFKVLLIGLDGGIKNKRTKKIFTQKELFSIIDGMPMRRRELKRNH
ncbi:hypothetical protein BTO06_11625 [Tenacibaculum sp. SZ-18]|uniref:DUF4174 domain-containing protein n=1 Tax=Tenacibaculum sp. SZ-18 TaxID=754423 RepID=UPI000C2D3DB4|nr:DUF4174 domain-containing protein [Tenacibaculum sp. SZ-18]AUC15758.1 hypothetical protein BTO06_11625 [Tenacibaculum sp. SZ-18]